MRIVSIAGMVAPGGLLAGCVTKDDDYRVIPGFTYDSRKDGYAKTSFWWRFFRYENDPKEGRKIDFLFIPIWR